MPKNDSIPGYNCPFTSFGVRLGGEESFAFHLHETGYRTITAEWNYPGVRSPFWRLYWNNRPGGWIECSGQRFDLNPKGVLLVPSHVLFDTHGSPRPVTLFWVHFSIYPDLTATTALPVRVPCPNELANQIASLAEKVRNPESATPLQLRHMCSSLLHQVFAADEVAEHPPQLPPKLSALLLEIESSTAQPILVTTLARRAGMSQGGFIRWFKKHMKVSPARYMVNRRIDHACRLLKFSSDKIEVISEKLGFASRSHFSRTFQRQMGSGPAFFRKS